MCFSCFSAWIRRNVSALWSSQVWTTLSLSQVNTQTESGTTHPIRMSQHDDDDPCPCDEQTVFLRSNATMRQNKESVWSTDFLHFTFLMFPSRIQEGNHYSFIRIFLVLIMWWTAEWGEKTTNQLITLLSLRSNYFFSSTWNRHIEYIVGGGAGRGGAPSSPFSLWVHRNDCGG